MSTIIADVGDPDGDQLPRVIVFNLGAANAEPILHPRDNGLDHLPLALEGLVFGQAEPDLTQSNLHRFLEDAVQQQISPGRSVMLADPGHS